MNITVNGKVLEHSVGDRYYYIGFGEDGWTPEVRKSGDSIEKIEITKDGVAYFAGDNYEMNEKEMKDSALFWTEEEARKWFNENIPEQFAFKSGDEFFYVLEKTHEVLILMVRMVNINCLIIHNGQLMYEAEQITVGYGNRYYFTAEDLGTTLFRTYEEADKKRKELE